MHSASDKSPWDWWALLKDLKSNAQWTDSDQYAQLEHLTSFFRDLYNDQSLQNDSNKNPDIQYWMLQG